MEVCERGVLPSSRVFFHTPGKASQELFLTLVCTGRFDCDKTYRVERRGYDSGLILLVLSGSGYAYVRGSRQTLHAGSILLLDCYGPHCYGTDSGWSILWVHFSGRMARELLQAAEAYPPCIPPGERSFAMRRAMESLYAMFGPNGHPVDGDIHRKLTELITPFLTPEGPTAERESARCMDRIAAAMSAHLSEDIPLTELAAMAHMSVSQLGRLFKKEKGMSPHQYLLEARLNAVRFFLSSTDMPLSRIAEQCGFVDASALTNAFRRRMGITPRAYANLQRSATHVKSAPSPHRAAHQQGDMTMNQHFPAPSTTPSPVQQALMARRFGMFLHLGVNTFGNVEWSDGAIDARSFQMETIDADQWVRTAWEAGMNYVILITKHHDGFCLWPTQTTEYCVRNAGCKTDVVAAVADACRRYGIKLGLYYSLWDRSAKEYREDFDNAYIPMMMRQLEELLDGRYGEIAELWLDGTWDKTRLQWRMDELYHQIKVWQPDCAVGMNHTVGIDRDEPGFPDDRYQPMTVQEGDPLRMFPSDFRLWDGYAPREDDPKLYTFKGQTYYLPFEMTVCSREGFSWFYSNIYEQKPLTNVDTVVEDISRAFRTGNAAVINMPPATNGRLVPGDVEHLMEISRRLGLARV